MNCIKPRSTVALATTSNHGSSDLSSQLYLIRMWYHPHLVTSLVTAPLPSVVARCSIRINLPLELLYLLMKTALKSVAQFKRSKRTDGGKRLCFTVQRKVLTNIGIFGTTTASSSNPLLISGWKVYVLLQWNDNVPFSLSVMFTFSHSSLWRRNTRLRMKFAKKKFGISVRHLITKSRYTHKRFGINGSAFCICRTDCVFSDSNPYFRGPN